MLSKKPRDPNQMATNARGATTAARICSFTTKLERGGAAIVRLASQTPGHADRTWPILAATSRVPLGRPRGHRLHSPHRCSSLGSVRQRCCRFHLAMQLPHLLQIGSGNSIAKPLRREHQLVARSAMPQCSSDVSIRLAILHEPLEFTPCHRCSSIRIQPETVLNDGWNPWRRGCHGFETQDGEP